MSNSAVIETRQGGGIDAVDFKPEHQASKTEILGTRSEKKPRSLLSGAELKSGYLPRSEFYDALYNRSIALVMLLLTLPLFGLVLVLQMLTTRGDIFYRGPRLGRKKEIFHILKFRTLEKATHVTGDRTLPRRNTIQTPLGPYLRACRLDELPQLINILRGDMVLFGPRPVRAEMEWLYMNEAPGYSARFAVRPGLVGLAQALTTHETPKAVRARLNAMCCKTHTHYGWLTLFAMKVGLCVLWKSVVMVGWMIRDWRSPLSGHSWINSGFTRTPNCKIEATIDGETVVAALCGMSDEVIQFVATQPFPTGEYKVKLERKRRGSRKSFASVSITILDVSPVGLGHAGFLHHARYENNSVNAQYTLERYFLRSALVPA